MGIPWVLGHHSEGAPWLLGFTGSVLRGSRAYAEVDEQLLRRTLFGMERRELQGDDPFENCPVAQRSVGGHLLQ